MKWSVHMTSTLAFSATLLPLIVVNVLSYQHSLSQVDIAHQVVQAHGVVVGLERTRSSIMDAESSVRGYMITHDAAFAKPVDRSIQLVHAHLYDVAQDVQPGKIHSTFDKLNLAVQQRLSSLNEALDHCKKGEFEEAERRVRSGAAEKETEEIRQLVTELETEENRSLGDSISSLHSMNQQSLSISLWATLLSAAVLMLTGSLIARQFVAQGQREEDERRQKESLNAMLSTIGDGLIMVSTQGQVLTFNPTAVQILGKGKEESLKLEDWCKHYGIYQPDRQKLLVFEDSPIAYALKGISTDQIELYVSNDALPYGKFISATGRTLHDRDGQPWAAVIVFRDITQRKEAEQRLNEFYAVLSHELRTPLTSIRGSLGLIEGGVAGPLPEPSRELVTIARVEVDRLIRLADNILDLKKVASGSMKLIVHSVSPQKIVQSTLQALQALAKECRVHLIEDVQEQGPFLCDADKLTQVLNNLVSNAIKFSPENTSVAVQVTSAAGLVRFAVIDKGPGIPPECLNQLFSQYHQLEHIIGKRKGTGLGLSICKALVEQHGGKIGVESTVGVGSTFWFMLPLDGSGIKSAKQSDWIRTGRRGTQEMQAVGKIEAKTDETTVASQPSS